MTIQVQVNDDEIDISFTSSSKNEGNNLNEELSKEQTWTSIPNEYNANVTFTSEGYSVISIEYSNNIVLVEGDSDATKNLLIYRIQEKLKEVVDAEQSGIEYTGEATGITPLSVPKPYDPDKIKVRQDKFSVEYVVNKMIAKGIIDLNPEFQRKFVWDKKRQSNLIESLMLGIPIPVFYLAEANSSKYYVIDGLQRLSSLRDFLNSRFALRNLEHLSDYDGCFFDEKSGSKKLLDNKMTTRIETAQLHFNIIEATSPSEVKYDIFTRLNTGGQPLNNQEVRNCLSEKHVRAFLNNCANSEIFKKATGYSVNSKRMDDQEMVLRFAGFYLQKLKEMEYSGDMNPFLNDVLDNLNKKSTEFLNELSISFLNAMENAYHLFGQYSFRKCVPTDLLSGARKRFINKSLFVVWSIALTDFKIKTLKEKIKFETFSKTLAACMTTTEKNEDGKAIVRYSTYYWLFTSATSDKKSLNSASTLTSEIIKDFLTPKLV